MKKIIVFSLVIICALTQSVFAADTTPPTVTYERGFPTNYSTNANQATVKLIFSEPVTGVGPGSGFILSGGIGSIVGQDSFHNKWIKISDTEYHYFIPQTYKGTFVLDYSGPSGSVKDLAGNAMASNNSGEIFDFTPSLRTPIYRLYNTRTGVHLYTRGEADRDKILTKFPDFEFTDGVPAFYASLVNGIWAGQ